MVAIDRRRFVKATAALAALTALRPRFASAAMTPGKAVPVAALPGERSYLDRFRLAADAGFGGVEMLSVDDRAEAEQIRAAARRTGLRIPSVIASTHGLHPLSSADPGVVRAGVADVERAVRNARLWGADTVLLGPAGIDPVSTYQEAWSRSQEVLRERILPRAREHGVVVAVEDVWNGFLLSPHELARYVDELDSRWAKACLDVGNIVFYAYPEDRIRTLGRRIATVRLRDFRFDGEGGRLRWKDIGDGVIDWAEVRNALGEIGFDGWVTAAIGGGDAARLRDVAVRVDRVLGRAT